MKAWLNFNGNFIDENSPVIKADNRSFRYGDGLFETMKVVLGSIRLKDLHFGRLFFGMEQLQMHVQGLINAKLLEEQVMKTIRKNNIAGPARVRLTMYRGDGGLYDTNNDGAGYVIQVWNLSSSNLALNDNGLVVGLYEAAKKSTDAFSNIKTNNYLVYAMGALYAKQEKYNDCLILNTNNRVCDSTIANVFWVKDGNIYTPPLSEGCVAGVMRANLIQKVPGFGLTLTEKEAEVQELMEADELFLTNAVTGIRWVKEFDGKTYNNDISSRIFHSTI
jgi:branched-chain amino acid aminotransferase